MPGFVSSTDQNWWFQWDIEWVPVFHHASAWNIIFLYPVLDVTKTVPVYIKSSAYIFILCCKNTPLRKELHGLQVSSGFLRMRGLSEVQPPEKLLASEGQLYTRHDVLTSHCHWTLNSLSGSHRMQWLPIFPCCHLLWMDAIGYIPNQYGISLLSLTFGLTLSFC